MADYNSNYTGQEVDAAVGYVKDLTVTATNVNTTVDTVTNNAATLGDVLTADGAGGASWQPAGGGGSIYSHSITLTMPNSGTFKFDITTTDASAYTASSFATKFNNLLLYISGFRDTKGPIYSVLAKENPLNYSISYIDSSANPWSLKLASLGNADISSFTDNVRAL